MSEQKYYRIEWGQDPTELQAKVEKLVEQDRDWVPTGGPVLVGDSWYQAMVRVS